MYDLQQEVNLVGLAGKMQSGKDTLAEKLLQLKPNTDRFALADEVKRIARETFGWNGLKDQNGRKLLQQIGEGFRKEVSEDFWLRKVYTDMKNALRVNNAIAISEKPTYFITDIRYVNEAYWIHRNGGSVYVIEREGYVGMDHVSEQQVEDIKKLGLVTLYIKNEENKPEKMVNTFIDHYWKEVQ